MIEGFPLRVGQSWEWIRWGNNKQYYEVLEVLGPETARLQQIYKTGDKGTKFIYDRWDDDKAKWKLFSQPPDYVKQEEKKVESNLEVIEI